jgi:hypothetical protein
MGKFMPTPEKILKEMDTILTELISTAERLQDISHQVISKEELTALQESQSGLVKHLMELDNAFKLAYKGEVTGKNKELRANIEKKLERFEKLNANFIENLAGTHPLLKYTESKSNKKPTG